MRVSSKWKCFTNDSDGLVCVFVKESYGYICLDKGKVPLSSMSLNNINIV